MPMPKSVTKIRKIKGRTAVEFTSNVDRAQYTITELSRAALRDVAKLIRRLMIDKLKKLPGMKRSKRIYNSTQYWVRKKETDLQIGFKHDTWYGVKQELGDSRQPKRSILRDTVFENTDQIRDIEGKYLSAIENEREAQRLIDEREAIGDEQNS